MPPPSVDGVEAGIQDNEAFYIKEYLDAKLETVSCLRYWEKHEHEVGARLGTNLVYIHIVFLTLFFSGSSLLPRLHLLM